MDAYKKKGDLFCHEHRRAEKLDIPQQYTVSLNRTGEKI